MSEEYRNKINELANIIKNSNKVCFFGGAGVSTGSGIPDFRSVNGLYNEKDAEFSKFSPEYYLSHDCFVYQPKDFYNFYRKKLDARKYEPNIVHKFLAKLEKEGKLNAVVTQNIDTLHEKAGTEKLFKIHGTIDKNHCVKCHAEYDGDFIFDSKEDTPRCPKCGKFVKPDVVLYGEGLPDKEVGAAIRAISDADCLIICGCSLTVYPAASFIDYFGYNLSMEEQEKTKLIVINRDETERDHHADMIFREDMNEVFKDLAEIYEKN
jgi:NAD-dependent deacetylase